MLSASKSTQENKKIIPPAIGASLHNGAVYLEGSQTISDGLNATGKILGLKLPGQGTFLSNWQQGALKGLAFLGSALSIKETWESGKRLYYAENKNLEKIADFTINLFRTVTIGFVFAGLATGALYGLPYLIPIGAGLAAGWSFYQAIKKSYQAYKAHKAHDKEKRNDLLKEAGLYFLSSAINGLTLGFGFVMSGIGDSLKQASGMFLDGVKNLNFKEIAASISLTQSAGSMFQAFKPLGYALGALLTMGTVASFSINASKNFNETLDGIFNPRRSIQEFGSVLKNKFSQAENFMKKTYGLGAIVMPVFAAFELTTAVLNAGIRLTQFIVYAPVIIVSKIGSKLKSLLGWNKKPEHREPIKTIGGSSVAEVNRFLKNNEISASIIKAQTEKEQAQQLEEARAKKEAELRNEYKALKEKVTSQAVKLFTQDIKAKHKNSKISAKLEIVNGLDNKLGNSFEEYNNKQNISEIEMQAKRKSSLVYNSIFRDVSRTKEVVELAKSFEEKYMENTNMEGKVVAAGR